jgi:hypothetical protein
MSDKISLAFPRTLGRLAMGETLDKSLRDHEKRMVGSQLEVERPKVVYDEIHFEHAPRSTRSLLTAIQALDFLRRRSDL